VKISRHGRTHGAESEEADTHRGILTGCGKAKKSAEKKGDNLAVAAPRFYRGQL
jgi:hypothetical protein